jgi:hypothetical protein
MHSSFLPSALVLAPQAGQVLMQESRVVYEAAQLWFAAGGLDFCWIRAQRQPWLRNNYAAGAGYGNVNP